MSWEIFCKFIANNPASILILLGGLGWFAQGLGLGTFSGYYWFIIAGIALQVLWIFFKK